MEFHQTIKCNLTNVQTESHQTLIWNLTNHLYGISPNTCMEFHLTERKMRIKFRACTAFFCLDVKQMGVTSSNNGCYLDIMLLCIFIAFLFILQEMIQMGYRLKLLDSWTHPGLKLQKI